MMWHSKKPRCFSLWVISEVKHWKEYDYRCFFWLLPTVNVGVLFFPTSDDSLTLPLLKIYTIAILRIQIKLKYKVELEYVKRVVLCSWKTVLSQMQFSTALDEKLCYVGSHFGTIVWYGSTKQCYEKVGTHIVYGCLFLRTGWFFTFTERFKKEIRK